MAPSCSNSGCWVRGTPSSPEDRDFGGVMTTPACSLRSPSIPGRGAGAEDQRWSSGCPRAAVGQPPRLLPAARPGRPMNGSRWGPGRAGRRLGAPAGQQRQQQQPEQQQQDCAGVFPLSHSLFLLGFGVFGGVFFGYFSPPGLLFLAALTKRAAPPQAGLFKRSFSSAAKLGDACSALKYCGVKSFGL